jgi:hypothetical protein
MSCKHLFSAEFESFPPSFRDKELRPQQREGFSTKN